MNDNADTIETAELDKVVADVLKQHGQFIMIVQP